MIASVRLVFLVAAVTATPTVVSAATDSPFTEATPISTTGASTVAAILGDVDRTAIRT